MGTPTFAVASLTRLIDSGCSIVAVVTAPDKAQGRSQQLIPSPVKMAAMAHQIPVLQPPNLKAPTFIEELKSYAADLQIVVAFRMLPEVVWRMPPHGTFNLHASLLPDYRGAAPINWAIINGETTTGVTTFFLQQEIDTGRIIFQESEPIDEDDDAGTLHDRLMIKGANLVARTALAIQSGLYPSEPQRGASTKLAPKIFRETCEINWNLPSRQVRNFIRGLCPVPSAWTERNGMTYKIFNVSQTQFSTRAEAGEWTATPDRQLLVRVSDGWLSIDEIQPEGKKRMKAADFLRGNSI